MRHYQEDVRSGFFYNIASDLFERLKDLLWFFVGQFISLDHSTYTISLEVFDYLYQNHPKFEWGGSTHKLVEDRTRKVKMYFARLPKSNTIFLVNGWPVYASSYDHEHQDEMRERKYYFLRWGLNWGKVLYDAKEYKQKRTEKQNRFGIYQLSGNTNGAPIRASRKGLEAEGFSVPQPGVQTVQDTPVGFTLAEIAEVDMKAIDLLSLTPEMEDVLADVRFMLAERKWFTERGLPWKKGFLFYGPPGTGKTSFARALAEKTEIPLYEIDLGSMDNEDLNNAWSSISNNTPAIALIEDIDRIFDKDKNVNEEGVDFACLLKCLDGAKKVEGIIAIITTNHPEKLDEALWKFNQETAQDPEEMTSRPGRIDQALELRHLPDANKLQIAKRIVGEEFAQMLVSKGSNDSSAQFQERCKHFAVRRKMAERKK